MEEKNGKMQAAQLLIIFTFVFMTVSPLLRNAVQFATNWNCLLSAAFYGGKTDLPVTVEYISKSKCGTHDIKLYISVHDGYYEMEDFIYTYGTGNVFDENEKPRCSLDAEQITLDGSALQFVVKDIH